MCGGSLCQEAGSDGEGEGVRKREKPALRVQAVAYSVEEPWVHWLQQYSLQKVRAGVKHCQPFLQEPVDSQVMGLRTLSDNQCSPHRSGAFSSNSRYGPGLGGRDDGGLLPGPRGSERTGHQDLGTLQKGSQEVEGQSYWEVA